MTGQSTNRVLLGSAARTVATATGVQTDIYARFVRLYLSITAASGTGGLSPVFRGYDRISGSPVELTAGGGAPITAAGVYCYEINAESIPTAVFGNVKEAACRQIPYQWDVTVKVGDASSYTYSLSADIGC